MAAFEWATVTTTRAQKRVARLVLAYEHFVNRLNNAATTLSLHVSNAATLFADL